VSDPGNETPDAQRSWALLRVGGKAEAAGGIPTIPSPASGQNGPVRYALGPHGEARLLLPLAAGEDPRILHGAPSLDVDICWLVTGRNGPIRFLDLICRTSELEAVFARVADHIVGRVGSGAGCVDAAHMTIEEFRRLLLRPPASQVTIPRVAGLVGELLVLKRLLDLSPEAWKSWSGPTGARHDFTRGMTALEVKATLGRGRTKVMINGLEQLAEPDGGRLCLLHFELEAVTDGPLTVSSLGRAVIGSASEPERVVDLLAAAGCTDVDGEDWNRTAFRVENETLYEVRSEFPRLVSSMLPTDAVPGISDVSYTVDLAIATSFRLDRMQAGELEALLIP
jgi:hypothetical protein